MGESTGHSHFIVLIIIERDQYSEALESVGRLVVQLKINSSRFTNNTKFALSFGEMIRDLSVSVLSTRPFPILITFYEVE